MTTRASTGAPPRSFTPKRLTLEYRALIDIAGMPYVCVYLHIMIPEYLVPSVAARFKALSDPSRLRLLCSLHKKEYSVSDLVEATGRRQPSVSQSLAQLATAGLVASRRDGVRVLYRLSDPHVARICDVVCRSVIETARKQAKALAGPLPGRSRQRA